MDMNRLTQKSQEALHDAQTKALRFGHTEVDGEHLLLALLDQPDGLVPRLVTAAGADAVVTTEKDAVRLEWTAPTPLLVHRIEAVFEDEGRLREIVLRVARVA